MSRAYWVKLSSSVTETIHASDKATHKIDLEAVVPEGEMKDIVARALEETGWSKTGDHQYEKQHGDTKLVWDVEKGVVEATVEKKQDVEKTFDVEGRAFSQDQARQEAKRQIQEKEKQARDQIGSEEERLQRELTKSLEEGESGRVREINEVLQRVYSEAVKRKAKRLGNILSVQESTSPEGEYQLTITIAE